MWEERPFYHEAGWQWWGTSRSSLLCRPAPCFSGTPLSPSRGSLRAATAYFRAFSGKSPPPPFPQPTTSPTTATTSQAPRSPRASPCPTPTQKGQVLQEEARASWVPYLATGKNPDLREARGLDLPPLLGVWGTAPAHPVSNLPSPQPPHPEFICLQPVHK